MMTNSSPIRWIKGLMPTLVILFVAALFGMISWLAVQGVPAFVIREIEGELSEQGFPVKLGKVKILLWPRAVVSCEDLILMPPGSTQLPSVPLLSVKETELSLNWKKLLNGEIDVQKLIVRDGNVRLAPAGEHPERIFTVADLQASLDLTSPESLEIMQATATIQGIHVNVNGRVPLSGSSDESIEWGEAEWVSLKNKVNELLVWFEQVHWKQAPQLTLTLSEGTKSGDLHVRLKLEAEDLKYRSLQLNRLFFQGEYENGFFVADQCLVSDAITGGVIHLYLHANLDKRLVAFDLNSSAPLISWTTGLIDRQLLPKEIVLHSEPRINASGKMVFQDNWDGLEHLNFQGSCSVNHFTVAQEPFSRVSCDFSYSDRQFYIMDLELRDSYGALTGKAMGSVDGLIRLNMKSTLPLSVMMHIINSFRSEEIALPEDFSLDGAPTLTLIGTMMSDPENAEGLRMGNLKISVEVGPLSYKGVDFQSLSAKAELIGSSVNLTKFELIRHDGSLNLEGSYLGTDAVFTLSTTLSPEILVHLSGQQKLIPQELTLPKNAEMRIHGRLNLVNEKPEPILVNLKLKTEEWAWNNVPIKKTDLEAEYRPDQLFIQQGIFELDKGRFEIFANGFLSGQMFLMGQSSIPLPVIDKLLGLEDDDFFMERFQWNDQSRINVSFQGTLGFYNIEKAYDLSLGILIENAKYKGVAVSKAETDAHLSTNRLVMNHVKLTVANAPYLKEVKLSSGVSECTLTAKTIDFLFDRDTVEVQGLDGKAYPAYTLRMFSDDAAEVMQDFLFLRPVTLSGNGVFPMGDDFSLMKGKIRFDASNGLTKYPLLGTTLELGNVQGIITISPEWVVVDQLKGSVWEGTFSGRVLAQIDHGDALNGSFVLQDQNLAAIGRSYDTEMNPAQVYGAIDFTSKGGRVNTIQGKGEVALIKGNLVELPLFGFLGEALSDYIPGVGHLMNYKLTRADCDFTIANGYVCTEHFVAEGSNMSMNGGGWIRIDDLEINSNFRMALRGLPGLLTFPVLRLARGLLQVRGTGPLNNVKWNFSPFSGSAIPVPPTPQKSKSR